MQIKKTKLAETKIMFY